ncbi:hypothetical protein BS50DRAFT_649948 [Corynespora cassiicola Philippines]|uniref:Alcohol acetyltransferase n=1 Tax=Corynespora cassiicola Philippines TaxID=1448308 RepID=A0A2T2NBD7_CORCC|nr:hypothetical protein BS50DRAFT_649948 [Corynespora cassiicola Philippines]
MSSSNEFQRFASPNEQRTISREDAGFYHAVIVAAIYDLGDSFDMYTPESFFEPLRACIKENPYLSVTVGDMNTDKAFFQKVPTIDLLQHVSILERWSTGNAMDRIENILEANLDTPFLRNIPPWRIIVLPLERGCCVAFSFSHMIGDGPTGSSFHSTFLSACRNYSSNAEAMTRVIHTPSIPLPNPFDTPQKLPISWSFLLSPLISLFLPTVVTRLFGLRSSASVTNTGTWNGSKICFHATATRSKLKMREIKATNLQRILDVSRKHDAKLTGTLLQVIARALSASIPDTEVTNFVSQTPINMRAALGVPSEEGGDFVSGCYMVHPRQDPSDTFSEDDWEAARLYTVNLSRSSSTLQDQAIGLLRYLPSIKNWTLGKIGQQRDCSFELSNIGAFTNPNDASASSTANISQMIFAQPGHVISAPLAFSISSVKNGSMFYTVSWRLGALGFAEDDEDRFVDRICGDIERTLTLIS